MSMNTGQVRVVDPILSDHARGYQNADFVGGALFPQVWMPTRGAKRIEFDRASFKRRRTRRAPGAPIATLEFGYEGKNVNLHQEALSGVVPIEHKDEAQAVPHIDLQQDALDTVLAVIALEKEIQQAGVARNAASYAASNKAALAGDSKWSDPDSDPKTQVFDSKEVIRKRIGRRPNTLVLAGGLTSALGKHPKIIQHFAYTNSSSITIPMLANYFDVQNVVSGDAIYDLQDGTTVDVWGGDAILAYVAPSTSGRRNMALPSYGYTYELLNHPLVEAARYDADIRSWKNDVIDEFSAELVGPDAGFLFQDAL
ncbi:hypothetical protein [Novosphingobium sp. KACC 22771]|uniref:hypothetical protein n=1 Tax=Novosphingobium sp. KACC 22771 TaxID=3025670 RepID=UPI0023660808|nr:hypothetical protein [Novosphingobium sp. KACC 22771]WDF73488.1 hypothetical protein PQ467_05435 [Novosphingobium sp. KACC 22771]